MGGYTGALGEDNFSYHSGSPFSTFDRDNNPNLKGCPSWWQGGWWWASLVNNANLALKQTHPCTHSRTPRTHTRRQKRQSQNISLGFFFEKRVFLGAQQTIFHKKKTFEIRTLVVKTKAVWPNIYDLNTYFFDQKVLTFLWLTKWNLSWRVDVLTVDELMVDELTVDELTVDEMM